MLKFPCTKNRLEEKTMEKNFYDQFKLMELRPAIYNGREIDLVPVVFYENNMYKVETEEVKLLV